MNSIDRIKILQRYLSVKDDGVIGEKTLSAFANKHKKTRSQVIHFFANIHHESGGFKIDRENMSYTTADRIMKIFGDGVHSAKITLDEAKVLVKQPYKLAERVYGILNPRKAKELGNSKKGDGYNYRGGGALQCTGGADYLRYGGDELYQNPDLISDSRYYFETAIREFDFKNIWSRAIDLSDKSIESVCRVVNGGLNGIDDRKRLIKYYDLVWK